MSNVQIPNLPVAIALNGTEQIESVQSGVSVRLTTAQISSYTNIILTNNFSVLMLSWFNALPTTLPGSPGVLWNNGGTLAQS